MNNDEHDQNSTRQGEETGSGSVVSHSSPTLQPHEIRSTQPEQDHIRSMEEDLQSIRRRIQRDNENELEEYATLAIESHEWLGPTPSPETLRAFHSLDPMYAERAFRMAEEAAAVVNYEIKSTVDADVQGIKRGQWMLFILAFGLIILAVVSVMSPIPWVAPVWVIPMIVPLARNIFSSARTKRTTKGEH